MQSAVDKETAEQYLRDAEPMWRAFWFHMHLMAKNLEQFSEGLKTIDDQVYLYHSEGHKNDLAKWVREVIGDGALADDLEKVQTRDEAISVTERRVEELKEAVGNSRERKAESGKQ